MKIATSILLLLWIPLNSFTTADSIEGLTNPSYIQAGEDDITALLSKLNHRTTEDKSGTITDGPSLEVQRQVPERLLEIANQSPEARARVIQAMIRVIEDQTARQEFPLATKWMIAVRIVGRLKAIEAIDALIDNLDQTGQNGIILSLHFRPVVGAIIDIGNPAIPKLIEALSHYKPSIRREAAVALVAIDEEEGLKAIRRAAATETDEDVLNTIKAILRNHTQATNIEVCREASASACSDRQIVAAVFHVAGADIVPVRQQTACARAPVEITWMSVRADGSYFIHFRNLDAKRRVVGVAYLVTPLDEEGNAKAEPSLVGGILPEPTKPGEEMAEDLERPHGQIKPGKARSYLVRFASIKFDDSSEWQFNVDCDLSSNLSDIRCKELKQ